MAAPWHLARAGEEGESHPRGEWLALGALLLPWYILSAFLPTRAMLLSFLLLTLLAGCLLALTAWARMRARALGVEQETWALAMVLTLGYGALLLLGGKDAAAFETMCDECGKLQEARAAFCYSCGAL